MANQLFVEKSCRPSSQERRDAAEGRVRSLLEEELQLRNVIKAAGDTVAPLVEMAQFAVDVDGDPAALARLRVAIGAHRAKDANKSRLADLLRELAAARRDEIHYRWRAGALGDAGVFFIYGHGDTRAEAVRMARARMT